MLQDPDHARAAGAALGWPPAPVLQAGAVAPPSDVRVAVAPQRRRPRRTLPLEQLALALPERPARWRLSRLVLRSPHRPRILERLEFVRRFFPEMDGVTVRVGLAQKPGVLGWGSLDPLQPGLWVRPRRLHYFTIAHEFTHLLQARGLVPGGERACDLWALARSPLLIDHVPGYLRMPRALRALNPRPGAPGGGAGRAGLDAGHPLLLHEAARRAIAARARGDRRYLVRFEREVALALGGNG